MRNFSSDQNRARLLALKAHLVGTQARSSAQAKRRELTSSILGDLKSVNLNSQRGKAGLV